MARSIKNKADEAKRGSKLLKFFLVLILLVLVFGGTVFLFKWLKDVMFAKNPHFVLRGVETHSIGYWNGRNRAIEAELGLKLDDDNLFELDLKQLRYRLTRISNIKDASVERILPDLLRIQLEERIPRAIINSKNDRAVIDDATVIMPLVYYQDMIGSMPRITLSETLMLVPGNDIPEVQPAIDLLMTAVKYFPEFKVDNIWVSNPDRLTFVATYKQHNYKVVFPRRANFNHSFIQLREGIETNVRNNINAISYDLTHKNRIISR